MPPKKKIKVQCGVCGAEFDHYYRKTHNETQHRNLLLENKAIPYKTHGAAPNPFAAAALSRQKVAPLTSEAFPIIASSTKGCEPKFQLHTAKDCSDESVTRTIPKEADYEHYDTRSGRYPRIPPQKKALKKDYQFRHSYLKTLTMNNLNKST